MVPNPLLGIALARRSNRRSANTTQRPTHKHRVNLLVFSLVYRALKRIPGMVGIAEERIFIRDIIRFGFHPEMGRGVEREQKSVIRSARGV